MDLPMMPYRKTGRSWTSTSDPALHAQEACPDAARDVSAFACAWPHSAAPSRGTIKPCPREQRSAHAAAHLFTAQVNSTYGAIGET
jgi:hypothetical protein